MWTRYLVNLRRGGKLSYRQFHSGRQNLSSKVFKPIVPILLGSTILAISISAKLLQIECEDSNAGLLKGQMLVSELNKKLKVIREKLHKAGKPTPELLVTKTNDFAEIIFELDKNCNVSSLISTWSKILSRSNASPSYRLSNGVVELLSPDKKAKLVWRQDHFGYVVSIRKRDGFSAADVDSIVKGYEEVVLSFVDTKSIKGTSDNGSTGGGNNTSNDGLDFHFDRSRSPSGSINHPQVLQDMISQLFGRSGFSGWQGFDESGDDDDNDGFGGDNGKSQGPSRGFEVIVPRSPTEAHKGSTPNNSNSPITKLQSMGLVVYDPTGKYSTVQSDSNNNSTTLAPPAMSWDELAGYDDVKQQIEDTIINSYKYSDIYDSVVRKTRVVFESNKPKAILLEGPPGTGKTLTARILASKCERPLVVLQIDKIVSKWYGDSEKTLTKVCIFVMYSLLHGCCTCNNNNVELITDCLLYVCRFSIFVRMSSMALSYSWMK